MTTMMIAALWIGQVIDQSATYRASVDSVVWVNTLNNQWEQTSGTGVVVDADKGYVVTAYHVVENRLTWVYLPNRDAAGEIVNAPGRYSTATKGFYRCAVVRVDPTRDLALLRLIDKPSDLKAMKIASKASAPGEAIFAIGHSGPVLWGFSGGNVRRSFQATYQSGTQQINARIVETTVPVNKGDSGAPLINQAGEVAGIVSSFEQAVNQVQKGIDASEIRSFLADGK
jgi:serine protease Do